MKAWINFIQKSKPGDIILIKTNSIYGKIIRYVTGDKWNHSALVIDPTNGILLDAVFPFIKYTTSARYEKGFAIEAVIMRPTDKDIAILSMNKIKYYANQVYYKPYDLIQVLIIGLAYISFGKWISYANFLPVINNSKFIICSEMVYLFYKDIIGVDLFETKANSNLITPGMFFNSPILYPVDYYTGGK